MDSGRWTGALRPKAQRFSFGHEAVEKQHPMQVIELVLGGNRGKTAQIPLPDHTIEIRPFQRHAPCTPCISQETRDGQAALA